MMDKFEEHIRSIRKELDIYNPSTSLWKRIERRLGHDMSTGRVWLSAAAVAAIVLGASVLLAKPYLRQRKESIEFSAASVIGKTGSTFHETEIYYNNLINSLYTQAAPLLTSNPDIAQELTNDLSSLDSICSDIKKDLKDNIANQEVVEALILNYRIKIRLLEDILTIMQNDTVNPGKDSKYEL